jgi:hypothetical protein
MKYSIYFLSLFFCFSACRKSENTPVKEELKFRASVSNCAEYLVYKFGSYKGDSITFEIRNFVEKLDTANKTLKTIALDEKDAVNIIITNYKNYAPFSFCPGIIPKDYFPEPNLRWISIGGTISLQVKEKLPSPPIAYPMFKVDFLLKNVLLKNEKGETITISKMLLENAIIGGPLPG